MLIVHLALFNNLTKHRKNWESCQSEVTLLVAETWTETKLIYKGRFLGPRGPLVLPLMCPVRPALKIWITYIQAYMPHESSGDSSNQPCTV